MSITHVRPAFRSILLVLIVVGGLLTGFGIVTGTAQSGHAATAGTSASVNERMAVAPNFTVHFADSFVTNGTSPSSDTDLVTESNLPNYRVQITSRDGKMNASQIEDVFTEVGVQDGTPTSLRTLNETDVLDADFTGVPNGTYNFTVEMVHPAVNQTVERNVSMTVVTPDGRAASLEQSVVEEQRGDVAAFTVNLQNTNDSWVVIGSDELNYEIEFTVVDENNDSTVTVLLNTFEAGHLVDSIDAAGADTIRDYRLPTGPLPTDTRLAAASYPVQVGVADERQDVGVLNLEEPSLDGNSSVGTAPDRMSSMDVDQAREALDRRSDVGLQDWAVVRFNASGLYGYVDDTSDLDDASQGLSLRVTKNPRPNEESTDVERVEPNDVAILPDDDGNQLFVLVDTNGLETDRRYTVNFTIGPNNSYVNEPPQRDCGCPERIVRTANFTVNDQQIRFNRLPLRIQPTDNATISGSTTMSPGTNFTVEAVNYADRPFLKKDAVVVDENGTWSANLDFSDLEPGTEFTVRVFRKNMSAAKAPATIVEQVTPAEETTEEATPTETPTPEEVTPAESPTPEEATPTDTPTPEASPTATPAAMNTQPLSGIGSNSLLLFGIGMGLAISVTAAFYTVRG